MKKAERFAIYKTFGLSAHQIFAQEAPGGVEAAPEMEAAPPAGGNNVAQEVGELITSTYDSDGPDGVIALCYATQDGATQASMKEMLESDPDGTIDAMVAALTASPEACAAWEAFTADLAPAEEPGAEMEAEAPAPEEHQADEEEKEPEFKAGEAVEEVKPYGQVGNPVLITGIKDGCYVAGYHQARLGTFREVEMRFRRVGDSKPVSSVARVASTVEAAGNSVVALEMDTLLDELMNEKGIDKPTAAQALLDSKEGWYAQTPEGDYLLAVISGKTAQDFKYAQEEEEPGFAFHYEDDSDPDNSWMDEEDLERYRNGDLKVLQAYVMDQDGKVWASLGGISVGSEQDSYLQQDIRKELMDEAMANWKAEHGKQAARRIAVDSTTEQYFKDYFGAYGAQLIRPLAFKKSGKKVAQEAFDCPLCGQHITDGKPCGCGFLNETTGKAASWKPRKATGPAYKKAQGGAWESMGSDGVKRKIYLENQGMGMRPDIAVYVYPPGSVHDFGGEWGWSLYIMSQEAQKGQAISEDDAMAAAEEAAEEEYGHESKLASFKQLKAAGLVTGDDNHFVETGRGNS
jgi:hypothetical protein